MTRRDRRFAGTVNDTISSSFRAVEAERQRGTGAFGRVAVSPVLARETPSDLDSMA